MDYELSSYSMNAQTGVILVGVDGLKKLWSSLTFIKEIESIKCFFILNDIKVKDKTIDIPAEILTLS